MTDRAVRAPITGERVTQAYRDMPHSSLLWECSVATYEHAAALAGAGRVLDVGCGTGYGCAILARDGAEVVGVDVDADAIEEARASHATGRVSFRRVGDSARAPLPFDANSFDVVSCLQVIEHLRDPEPLLREAGRVLRPGGVALFATPNRLGRLWAWQRPWNRFHFREYTAAALAAVLRPHFAHVEIHGLAVASTAMRHELARTRRLRLLLLPATLPIVPDALRRAALALAARLRGGATGGDEIAFAARDPQALYAPELTWGDDVSENSPVLLAVCRAPR